MLTDFLNRVFGGTVFDVQPAREHGPRRYHQHADRPRGPGSYLIPPSFRQPVIPFSQPGIFRRYEFVPSFGAGQSMANSGGGGVFWLVPQGVIWRIVSFHCLYFCDATVNTRELLLGISADANPDVNTMVIASQPDVTLSAGQVARFVWFYGNNRQATQAFAVGTATSTFCGAGCLPERLILYENSRITLLAVNPAAGDVVRSVEVYVEEWTTFAGTAR